MQVGSRRGGALAPRASAPSSACRGARPPPRRPVASASNVPRCGDRRSGLGHKGGLALGPGHARRAGAWPERPGGGRGAPRPALAGSGRARGGPGRGCCSRNGRRQAGERRPHRQASIARARWHFYQPEPLVLPGVTLEWSVLTLRLQLPSPRCKGTTSATFASFGTRRTTCPRSSYAATKCKFRASGTSARGIIRSGSAPCGASSCTKCTAVKTSTSTRSSKSFAQAAPRRKP